MTEQYFAEWIEKNKGTKWEGVDSPEMASTMDRLASECDFRSDQWKTKHASDPCSRCGGMQDKIVPTGSLAKLTPLCNACDEILRIKTDAWHSGFNEGLRTARMDFKRDHPLLALISRYK